MATTAQSAPGLSRPIAWFLAFLREELAPYPGRAGTVARMVLAATLVMIVCMTFRLSYAFQAAIFVLLISRESPRSTLQSSGAILLVMGIGATYLLISMSFVIDVPMLHFLWVVCSLYLAFFALSSMANYGAAVIFSLIIALGVPIWDRHVPAYVNVEDTLRLTLSALVGVAATVLVELAFSRMRPGDEIVVPIADRLAAVQGLVACYVEHQTADQAASDRITRFAMLGTSRLRRLLRRSDYSHLYRLRMSSVATLVGWLVDIAASLPQLSFRPSSGDQRQLRDLTAAIASIRSDLINRRLPAPVQFSPGEEPASGVPLMAEMKKIVEFIPHAFAGSQSVDECRSPLEDTPRPNFLAADAFVNPKHIKFALKGCLAASLCYIIYNSLNWPGISTSVVTCLLTALTTIGASRQKQVLRFTGAFTGGFMFSMGSQIFILPHIDSIAGFTVLFAAVTGVCAWIMTSSPRLSYFGLQVALAFFLINLQEFAIQTSLLVARDRVIGILVGLLMMWLVFDQLWGAPALVEMKRTFISNLRLLARFARGPFPGTERIWVRNPLQETISTDFDTVNTLSDAVVFEFGPSRQQDLALRSQIRHWQTQLRLLFVTRIALLDYRLQLPGFELPETVRQAQLEFDNRLSNVLEGMADRMEEKGPGMRENLEESFRLVEQAVSTCCADLPKEAFTAQLEAFLPLSRRIETLASNLDKEM
jgi:multidrug resistance protein MdtO